MKRKTREYDQLKSEWTARVSSEDLEFIRGNVLKDVLRTDRAHPYYAGSEDSPHLTALTDLLTTFAITHPQVNTQFYSLMTLGCAFISLEYKLSSFAFVGVLLPRHERHCLANPRRHGQRSSRLYLLLWHYETSRGQLPP